MRRSAAVTLTLLAATGLGVAYCTSGADGDADGVLESESACVGRLGSEAVTECDDVFAAAQATHLATAPRFDTAGACRDATGSECMALAPELPGAAPVFIPVMAGVMIGRALADGTRGAMPVYAGMPPPCPPGAPAPPGCAAASAGSGFGSSGGGRRFWYSGSSYAGTSDGEGHGGFRRAAISGTGEGMLSRGTGGGSLGGGDRTGFSASRAGGLGFSAAAHGDGHGS